MSSKLAMRVLESDLAPALKPLLAAMALFANDAGERIYPSVGRVAFLVGVSHRTAERQIAQLRALRVLVPMNEDQGGRLPGGRGRSVQYWLNAAALPARTSYIPRHERRGLVTNNPDTSVGVSEDFHRPETPTPVTGTPTPGTQTPTPVSLNPDAGVGLSLRELKEELQERDRSKHTDAARRLALSEENTEEQNADQEPAADAVSDGNRFQDFAELVEQTNPKLAALIRRPTKRDKTKGSDFERIGVPR